MPTPILNNTVDFPIDTGTEVAAKAATDRAALMQSITPSNAMMEATKTVGAVAPSITGTLINTGLTLGALFFAVKGIQMAATGKNSFKNDVIA